MPGIDSWYWIGKLINYLLLAKIKKYENRYALKDLRICEYPSKPLTLYTNYLAGNISLN